MDEESRLVPQESTATELAETDQSAIVPVGVNELTTKIFAALDVIAALIPDLRKPHPETAKKVRGGRTVSREAVVSIVAMTEDSPAVQEMNVLDVDRAHEVLASTDAFRLLAERLGRFQAEVKYTAEARWAELTTEAMVAYSIAGVFAKKQKDGHLAAHLKTIRRHLGRKNGATGKKKKDEEPNEE
jgi:hypothetical protein